MAEKPCLLKNADIRYGIYEDNKMFKTSLLYYKNLISVSFVILKYETV